MNKQVGNVQLMQKMNRLKVLEFVRRSGEVSRPLIAEKTGLSLASITNITSYLLERGLLCESGMEKVGRVGRKSTLLRFCADRYDLVCVYINDKFIHVAYTDLEGNCLEKVRIETNSLDASQLVKTLLESVVAMVSKHDKERILGVGIAISGLVLEDSHLVVSASLKWRSVDIRRLIEEAVKLPVFVDNVSILKATYYFSKNMPKDFENMMFVDMENGIGAVQYVNGAVSRSTLGEIGHTTVEREGEECFCGNRGCLEAMCSPARLVSLYQQHGGVNKNQLCDIENAYRQKEEAARKAVAECGKYLGIGLANLVNLFNPSVFVVDTGDFSECPSLLTEAESEIKQRAYPALTQKLIIRQVKENENDILRGTAVGLCDRLFDIAFPDNLVE